MTETGQGIERKEFELTGVEFSLLLIAVIFLSCTYDYFYYFRLGFSFFQIPTSLSDHYRSSLECVPHVIFLIIFLIFIEPFVKIREFFDKIKINESKAYKEPLRKIDYFLNLFRPNHFPSFRERGLRLFIITLIWSSPLMYYNSEDFPHNILEAYPQLVGIAFVSGYIGLYMLFFYNFHQRNSIFNSKKIKFFNIIFSFFIFFAAVGFNTAKVELFKIINSLSRTLEYSQDGRTVRIGILKNLEKGIFGVNIKADKAEFYTWEELKKITYLNPKGQYGTKTKKPEKIEHKQPEKK